MQLQLGHSKSEVTTFVPDLNTNNDIVTTPR